MLFFVQKRQGRHFIERRFTLFVFLIGVFFRFQNFLYLKTRFGFENNSRAVLFFVGLFLDDLRQVLVQSPHVVVIINEVVLVRVDEGLVPVFDKYPIPVFVSDIVTIDMTGLLAVKADQVGLLLRGVRKLVEEFLGLDHVALSL